MSWSTRPSLPALHKVTAAEMDTVLDEIEQTRVLARGNRTTSSSTTTTEVGVLRVDNVAVKSGRVIRIDVGTLSMNSSVANDVIEAKIRISNSGTATTSSQQYGSIQDSALTAGSFQRVHDLSVYYFPASNETLSVLLSVARSSGTGNVSLTVGASPAYAINMTVSDIGEDPGDAGVDL